LLIAQAFSGFVSLVVLAVSSRLVGSSVIGLTAIAIVMCGIANDIIDYGACSYYSTKLASGVLTEEKYWEIAHQKQVLIFLTSTIFVTPAILIFQLHELFYFAIYPVLWVRMNYFQQYFFAMRKIKQAITAIYLEKLSYCSVILIYLIGVRGIGIVIGPVLIGLIIHSIVAKFYTNGNTRKPLKEIINMSKLKLSFKQSKYFGHSSVITDVANLDTSLVAVFLTISDSGTFSLFQRFRGPLLIGFQSFATNFRPVVALGNRSQIKNFIIAEKWYLFLNVSGICIFAVLSYRYSQMVFGNTFDNVNLVMCVGTLSTVPTALSLLCSTYLTSSGQEQLNAKILTLFVPLSLVGLSIAAYFKGIVVATITVLIMNLVLSCVFGMKVYEHWYKK
jgi:O-antigen/teichoic acid export membrane protein